MQRRNRKTKQVGNGEGSLYRSEKLDCWIYQYYDTTGVRKTITQRKKETTKDFKARVTEIKNSLNNGTYIAESSETVVSLASSYIENKYADGTISDRSYKRELETLEQIKKTCGNFCNMPIQKVTIKHIEEAKKEIRKYSNSVIGKIWVLLGKTFKIACSPSRKILIFNLMQDENLKKPISEKKLVKIKALSHTEVKKLNTLLDGELRNHPYRNIVKMQLISGMRIGEVLARSYTDYDKKTKKFNVHNTLTQDQDYKVILGEHTKTYNKQTQIDRGQRYLPLTNSLFNNLIDIINEQSKTKVKNMYNLLFWNDKTNTFVTPTEINAWLRRLNEKYKITAENLTTHRLRHTALTQWKELGLDLSVIQYLAGHTNGSNITSEVYINISEDYINNELKKFV